jgi:hypothetical protein
VENEGGDLYHYLGERGEEGEGGGVSEGGRE